MTTDKILKPSVNQNHESKVQNGKLSEGIRPMYVYELVEKIKKLPKSESKPILEGIMKALTL